MADVKYFSAEGLDKLKAELQDLKSKGRRDMANQIAEARDKGDLSENAEYDAAKEAQGHLEAKIAQLENDIAIAKIVDESLLDNSKVLILSTVKVKNLKFKKDFSYTLVSENEADIKTGKISVESPIGRGLLGKKVGEIAEVQTPGGAMKFEILEITRS